MSTTEPARTLTRGARARSVTDSPAASGHPIAVYGCDRDEAALVRELAPSLGVLPVITEVAVSKTTVVLARGSRCISVSHKTQVDRSTLRALRRAGVEYVSTRSSGYNHIDTDYAARLGLTVENVSYSPDCVADYTVMQMLIVLRNAKSTIRRVDAHDYRLNPVLGREMRDLIVGVVGTGRIGTAVIDRLRGFGCRILAYDPRPKIRADYVDLDELVRQSDIVSLHTPLTDDTHHLLDHHRIGQLKHGAIVINTGRGALLDTAALVQALESGALAGAALDVVEGEEGIFYTDRRDAPIRDSALLRLQEMSNVLVSPHMAYYTDHALVDMVTASLTNCLRFERETRWTG
jgi:D-specific alpha-keto acid dehydrogenase